MVPVSALLIMLAACGGSAPPSQGGTSSVMAEGVDASNSQVVFVRVCVAADWGDGQLEVEVYDSSESNVIDQQVFIPECFFFRNEQERKQCNLDGFHNYKKPGSGVIRYMMAEPSQPPRATRMINACQNLGRLPRDGGPYQLRFTDSKDGLLYSHTLSIADDDIGVEIEAALGEREKLGAGEYVDSGVYEIRRVKNSDVQVRMSPIGGALQVPSEQSCARHRLENRSQRTIFGVESTSQCPSLLAERYEYRQGGSWNRTIFSAGNYNNARVASKMACPAELPMGNDVETVCNCLFCGYELQAASIQYPAQFRFYLDYSYADVSRVRDAAVTRWRSANNAYIVYEFDVYRLYGKAFEIQQPPTFSN